MDRNLTGIFVRVQENGKWTNKDITDCTDEQIRELMQGRDAIELTRWISRITEQYTAMLEQTIDPTEIPKEIMGLLVKKVVNACLLVKVTGELFDVRKE